MARSAELFLTARKRQLIDRARRGTTHEQNKPPISKKEEIICHICRKPGHSTQNCRNKATHGRGCYHCGELTHMRKDCPKLTMNNSQVTSSKRARSACGLWKPKDQHQGRMREKQTPDMTSEPKSKTGCCSWRVGREFQP